MLSRGLLRRTGTLHLVSPAVWRVLLEQQAKVSNPQEDHASSVGRTLPLDTKAPRRSLAEIETSFGPWDPQRAAETVFAPAQVKDTFLRNSKALFNTRVLVGYLASLSLFPLYGLSFSGLFVPKFEIFMAAAASLTCVGISSYFHTTLVATVVSIRLLPRYEDSPVDTEVELGLVSNFLTSTVVYHKVNLSSISGLAASPDGEWRVLGLRERHLELYNLSCLPTAHEVIPYIAAMRRHLETFDSTLKPLTVCLATSSSIDPFRLKWKPDTDFPIPDPTVTDPYPNFEKYA